MAQEKVLVISPHPDDLDFGCSGTVAKWTKQGKEVVYCIVTNGEKGGAKLKTSPKNLIKIRKKEQMDASKVVGVKNIIFLGEVDGEVENTKDLRKKIVRIIRKIKPDIVITFDPASRHFDNFYRSHRDHRIVGETVFDSIYPAAGSDAYFPDLIKQGYKPHLIREAWFFATNNPNVFIDITKTIDKKIEALKQHKSQLTDFKQIEKRIKTWAHEYGKKAKVKYAEGFRKVEL